MRLLDDNDIATLNAARRILGRLEDECNKRAWDAPTLPGASGVYAQDIGRLAQAANAAEWDLFQVLNVANSHCHFGLTHAQLHDDARDRAAA